MPALSKPHSSDRVRRARFSACFLVSPPTASTKMSERACSGDTIVGWPEWWIIAAMASPYESANLLLKLYDMRREPTMRQARSWFITFIPDSADDIGAVLRSEH